MENTFKVGDLVELKAGGPVMTVEVVFKNDGDGVRYRCQWFSGKKLESGVFPQDSLQAAEKK